MTEQEEEQAFGNFGCMAGTIKIIDDIIEPIEQEWAALTGEEDDLYEGIGGGEV